MGISVNGPSGIDTQSLIDQLVSLEQSKVSKVQATRDSYSTKIAAYSSLKTYVTSVQSKAAALMTEESLNVFKSAVSDSSVVGLTAGTGAVAGKYSLNVFQTAQSEKLISADKRVASASATLTSLGMTSGTITLNGADIAISDTDTISDVRMKINNAKTTAGASIGVSATVLKVSDTNYRLVLTATDSGKAGVSLKDTSGNILQGLGVINSAAGDKGITYQKLSSVDSITTDFTNLAVGQSVEYAGKDRMGTAVTGVFTKTASSTLVDLQNSISDAFHGGSTVDITGGIVSLTDTVGGSTSMSLTSLSIGGAVHAMQVDQAGSSGANVLAIGQDAHFSVDNIMMESTKNTVSGFIAGVTLDLKKTTSSAVSIEMARDNDAITKKVNDLLGAFNVMQKFVTTETKWGDSRKGENSGRLSGDMTARSLVNQVKTMFSQQYNKDSGSTLTSLSMAGIKTNATTGEFELDSTKFAELLNTRFDDVVGLFSTRGWSSNSNIQMGRFTADTQEGTYLLTEPDAQHYQAARTGGTTDISGLRSGDAMMFTSGDAKGLGLTAPAGTGAASFTFSRGFSGTLNTLVSKLTDSTSGLFAMRTESFNASIKRYDERITSMNTRVVSYRDRLVSEFASMEKNLQSLKSQQSSMASQLGL